VMNLQVLVGQFTAFNCRLSIRVTVVLVCNGKITSGEITDKYLLVQLAGSRRHSPRIEQLLRKQQLNVYVLGVEATYVQRTTQMEVYSRGSTPDTFTFG